MKNLTILFGLIAMTSITNSQSVEIKDDAKPRNLLFQVNDEGNYGSMTITPWITAEPSSPATSKLSNNNGTLYWESTNLEFLNGSGWVDDGSVVRLVTIDDNVGIGTSSPSEKLGINGNVNLSESIKLSNEVIVSNAGDSNTLIGIGSGVVNTGARNTFIGYDAGNSNTTGEHNTFCGFEAGSDNETGSKNSFLGNAAGSMIETGNCNTYIGNNSGYNGGAEADSNTCIGAMAGYAYGNGSSNTSVGYSAGKGIQSGNYNAFMGYNAGGEVRDGNANIACGFGSGWGITWGNNNIYLGFQTSGGSNSDGSNNVFIGYKTGYNETGSDKLYIDNSDTATPLIGGDFAANEIYLNGSVGVGTESSDDKFEIEFGSDNIDVEFGRGVTSTDATFLAVRNSAGTKYYISVDNSGNILVSTTKP